MNALFPILSSMVSLKLIYSGVENVIQVEILELTLRNRFHLILLIIGSSSFNI